MTPTVAALVYIFAGTIWLGWRWPHIQAQFDEHRAGLDDQALYRVMYVVVPILSVVCVALWPLFFVGWCIGKANGWRIIGKGGGE